MQKKVILYNTTISAFLKDGKKMLKKMEAVFRFFEQQDGLILLWRPHPLLEATIRSMHPELLEQYLTLINIYKSKNIGILDESPDLHRAIALSDAYYGDRSSLADLYRITGKPLLLQNPKLLESKPLPLKYLLYICYFQFYQQKLLTENPEFSEKCWIGNSISSFIYSLSNIYNGKLFFSPCNMTVFEAYDLVSTKAIEIPLKEPSESEYNYLFQYNGNLLAIGTTTMSVCQYDETNLCFRSVLSRQEKRKLSSLKRSRQYESIPFLDLHTNELCIYHIKTNQWKLYPFSKDTIQDFLYDGEWCWILTKAGMIIQMEITTGTRIQEKALLENFSDMLLFNCDKTLLLLPKEGANCIHIDKKTLQSQSEIIPELTDGLQHDFIEITDTQLLVKSYINDSGWSLTESSYFWIYDYQKSTQQNEDFSEKQLYAKACNMIAAKMNLLLPEHPNMSLNYLQDLLSGAAEKIPLSLSPCGENIHKRIMEET